MNKSYRLILNEITQTWVAVAEITKGRGKRTSGAIVLTAAGILGAVTLPALAAPPNPLAVTQLPTGGQVVAGQATVQQAGSNMTVTQTSNRAAMDWATFNVGSEAQVNFLQPSSSAAILNRVLDPNPSQIFGRINANGQVFLTNPSGIYFGPSASANVGALTATTHSISNAEFMDGKLNFTRNGATGKVENEGTLTAALGGYIALLAPEVRNNGVIVAKMGTVALAAGELVEMQFEGSRLANVRVEPATIAALVENGNAVQAPGGLVILSARAIDQLQGGVVRNIGRVEASGLTNDGGVIRLTASDTIENTGSIRADAAPNGLGNGGAISLIADLSNSTSLTRVGGSITARGGDLGGNGGFIETSASRLNVNDSVQIDTHAPNGKNGQWLLDPVDITIGTDVSGTTIAAALLSSNVTLDSYLTGSCTNVVCGTLGGNGGNIIVNDNISVTNGTADTTLTLKATGSITVNAGKTISRTGGYKLNTVLWADSDGSNDGYIKFGSGSSIATNGGHLWMGGGGTNTAWYGLTVGGDGANSGYAIGDSTSSNGIEINGASLLTSGGNIALYGRSRTGAGAGTAVDHSDGVWITGGGPTTIDSGTGSIWIEGESRGQRVDPNPALIAIGVDMLGTVSSPLSITSSNAISIVGRGSRQNLVYDSTRSLYDSAGVSIVGKVGLIATLGGGVLIEGIAGEITYRGNSSAIQFIDAPPLAPISPVASVVNGSFTFTGDSLSMGNGTVSTTGGGTLTIQPQTANASISVGGVTGILNLPSAYFTNNFASGFSNITVGSANSGAITVDGATTFPTNTTLWSNSSVAVNSTLNATSDLTINSNGAVAQSGSITVIGVTSVSTGANSISLNHASNNFVGAVNLSNSANNAVSVRDVNALQLGAVSVGSGNLTIQTGGALTQTGAIVQETTATGVSLNAGNYDITLNNIGNKFSSTLSVVNAKKLDIVNSGYMKLGGIATSDDIFISTVHGDLELSQPISTTKAYSPLASAIMLNADSGASAEIAGGGNITVQSGLSPAITTGGNGVIQLLTGTINGSYVGGVGNGSGRFRYGSDEQPQKSYSTPLLDGINVIYREQPKFLVTPGIATSKYGDTASTGGVAASVTSASPSTYVNGDTASITSGIATFTTTATSTSHVGSYDISYSGGLLNSLGYGYVDANAGAGKYSITPRTLNPTLSNTGVTKTYDGTIAAPANFTPTYTISGQLAGDTPALSSTSATYDTAHVGATKVVVSGFIIAGIAGSNGSTVNDYVVDPTPKDVSASITAKQINASAAITGVDKTYDGLLAATGSTISGSTTGAINGDNVVLDTSAMTLAFDSAHAGNHSISGSGIATLGVSGVGVGTKDGTTGNEVAGATGDYTLSAQPTVTAVTKAITAKTLIASAAIAGADKTYDGLLVASGSTISGSTTGAINGDSVALDTSAMTLAFDSSHAGNHSISASGLATLGVSGVGVGTKDGTTGNEVAGAIGDYAQSAQPTVTAVTKAITAKTLTITGTTASDKTYDGNDIANINPGSLIGLVLSEKLNVTASGTFDNKNAGSRTATAVYKLIDGNNGGFAIDYNLANTTGHMATITQKPLTITANNDAKFVTQSDAASYNGVSYNGLVPGEGGDVLAGTLAYTRTNATSNSAGSYSGVLVPSGLTSNNYAISYANGDYTIVPADRLLVTVQNGTFTYGSDPAFTILSAKYLDRSNVIRTLNAPSQVGNTFSYNDGAGGTAVFTIGPLSAPQSTAGQIKAGSYNVDASNVTETSVNFDNKLVVVGAMTVAQKALIAKTGGATKVYDGNNAINNVVVDLSGLVPYDLVTLAGNGAFSQKSVGSNLAYSVSNVTLGGADASNYFLGGGATVSGTNGAITPKALAISGITVANKTYDGNNLATVSTAGVTSSVLVAGGMVAGDVVQVAATGIFNDKNAAAGKTVTLSSLYSGSDVDNYTITDQIAATANITPKALTITGTSAVDKTYDGNTTAVILPGLVTGFVGNENVAATANGTFDSKDAGIRSTSASYTLFDGTNGGLANNYRLGNTTGHVATISKASLTLTADSKARLYGQTNPPLTTSVSGFVNGETASTAKGYTGTGTATTLADISTPVGVATITAGAGSLNATNYDFTHLVDGVLTIQPLQALVLPPKVETRQLATPATDPPKIADRLNSMIGAAEPKDDDPACIGPADKTNMRCRPAK